MTTSSLSTVVSTLVRASMGTSVPSTVKDEDLDRHVAELILNEAKKKAERYTSHGIRAFFPAGSDTPAPRTNKRFLSSIIKTTEDHNKTVLRAQALAAQEQKRERDEQERRARRKRAEEAAEAERMRRGRRRVRREEEESWDRWDGRGRDKERKRKRDWERDWEEGSSRRERRRKYALDDVEEDSHRRSATARSEESSKRPCPSSSRSRSRTRTRSPSPVPKSKSSKRKHKSKRQSEAPPLSHSPRPPSDSPPPLPSGSPPPLPPSHPPSKMDKYFEESYDPRLDIAPLSVPAVPSTGLINNAEYAGWDAMLELLRVRREDKEEKRRLERLGFVGGVLGSDKGLPEKRRTGEEKEKEKEGEVSVMEIRYKKRGSVREWDLGKEGLLGL